MFAYYANIRMNLLPYIYNEARKTSMTGVPLMRTLFVDYPMDKQTYEITDQYFFGDALMVSPVMTKETTERDIYLPAGEWPDLLYNALHPGGNRINYSAPVNADHAIPVLVKPGSIIPLNLNTHFQLGGSIGNALDHYTKLVFRIFPFGQTSYDWYDDINSKEVTISVVEAFVQRRLTVALPALGIPCVLQVLSAMPASVQVNDDTYTKLDDFTNAAQGYYFDARNKLVYIAIPPHDRPITVTLEGVDKTAYEAEFAEKVGVKVNDNRAGYVGPGFVDHFTTVGNKVIFDVCAQAGAAQQATLRYSAGNGNATRAIYVDGKKLTDVSLPATKDWDTWDEVTFPINLSAGNHKIAVTFDNSNTQAIYLDNLELSADRDTVSESN